MFPAEDCIMNTLPTPGPGLRLAPGVFFAVLLVRSVSAGASSGAQDTAPLAPLDSPAAASVTVTVDLNKTHPISPYIYGNNAVGRASDLIRYVTLERAGGNRWTAYNWQSNASNAGSDWNFQNDDYLGGGNVPAEAVRKLIAADRKAGIASLITIQLQGLVAGDTQGPVNMQAPPDRRRFKEVAFEKASVSKEPFTTNPSLKEAYVYMDEFVWALDQKFPKAGIFTRAPQGPPVFVALDNEPDLWHSTHREIQGAATPKADDFIARSLQLARAIKAQFPDVVILGPMISGFYGLYGWNGELSPTPDRDNWFFDRYVRAVQAASATSKTPLIDVYAFHWYPEATDSAGHRVIQISGANLSDDQIQAIVQTPRSFWDPTYKERSWVSDKLGGKVKLLSRLESRLALESPAMKLAITEYNGGGGQHIAGTLAQADTLGILGAHGIFAACYWPLSENEAYIRAGFRAFRAFDGHAANFGDTSISASSSHPEQIAAYVSSDSKEPGRIVIVAINRAPANVSTSFEGLPSSGSARVYRMSAATAVGQTEIAPIPVGSVPLSGSILRLALPSLSVSTIEISSR
jgi:hypothetical protein